MNQAEKFRKVLEMHGLRSDRHELVEKCTGCPWIGLHHVEHLADELVKAVNP